MPLFTRRSNIRTTSTFFGASPESRRLLPSNRRVEPLRSRRAPPSYPSGRRQREITNATTTTFKTGYEIKDLEMSDDESDSSTSSQKSKEFFTNQLLSNGNFIIDESSESDNAPSEDITNASYSSSEAPRKIEDVRLKSGLRFTCEGSGPVTCISASRCGQAWVCRGNDKYLLHLYHRNGHKTETRALNSKVEDMAVRQDKSVFIIPYQSQTVKRVSATGKLTDFYSSADLATSGLCATSRFEILVTTKDVQKSQKKKPRARARPSVMRLTQTGDVIWDIKTKGADPFIKPGRLTVGKNGDICVIDAEPSREHVAILSPDGELKGLYYGVKDPILSRPFDPRDVCYDSNGYVYVADLVNSAVHVLDKQGIFHHFLFTKQDGIMYPSALTCDTDGFIWVGCASGTVHIFEVTKSQKPQASPRKSSK